MKEFDSPHELKELDRFFADTLNDASMEPSGEVWKEIERKLDDQPKRRFIGWFWSGLVLLIGFGVYLLLPAGIFSHATMSDRGSSEAALHSEATASVSPGITPAGIEKTAVNPSSKDDPSNTSERAAAVNTTEQHETNHPATAAPVVKKIQLAALRNHEAEFPAQVAGHEVLSEEANGLKKYYVAVNNAAGLDATLRGIQAAGYHDAFVVEQNAGVASTGQDAFAANVNSHSRKKENGLLAMNNPGHSHTKTLNSSAKESAGREHATAGATKDHAPVNDGSDQNANGAEKKASPVTVKNKSNASAALAAGNELGNSEPSKKAAGSNDKASVAATDPGKTKIPAADKTAEKNEQGDNPSQENTVTTNKANDAAITTGAVSEPVAASAGEQKNDSLNREPKPSQKVDSTKVAATPVQAPEPSEQKPPFEHFGVYLLGGPEFARPQTMTYNETKAVTYNGGLKLQFMPFRRFAVELGVSYQTGNSASSDDTLTFAKGLTNNTDISSNYGNMTVDPGTLMDGYSIMAPTSFFRVRYSYNFNYSILNIPLNLKFYPVKRDKLAVSVSAGVCTQKVISQSAQLTFYKENGDNVLTYNNLLSNKMSFSLLLGLGCEIRLYKHLYLVAEPNFRYGFSNLSATPGAKARMLNLDGNAGIKFSF